jgi:predicted neuraminidase
MGHKQLHTDAVHDKKILNVVVIVGVILWLLSVFGFIGSLQEIHIGG